MNRSVEHRVWRSVVVGVFTACAMLGSPGQCLAGNGKVFRAGAEVIDITPSFGPLRVNGGFLEKSVASMPPDSLHARCLVLDDGDSRIAFVIVDSCMIPRNVCDRAKQIAAKSTGLRTDRILIAATHTHSAPSVMDFCLGSRADPRYTEFLPARLAEGIQRACERLAPARVGWAVADASAHTHCRRWILRSDKMATDPFGERTVRAMMHPGYQNPAYIGPAGPIDGVLSLLAVQSPEGAPLAVLANFSMHYFGGGGPADYFAIFADKLAEKVNNADAPPPVCMMSQGTSGDLHWMDYGQMRRSVQVNDYADELASIAYQAYQSIEFRDWVPLAMDEQTLTLRRRLPDAKRLQWSSDVLQAMQGRRPQNRPEVYAEQAAFIQANPIETIKLQAIRIGELGMTAIPNEVYGITGLKLKLQSPLQPTFNIELANGAAGYIPPPSQHRLGGYTTWPARTAGLEEKAEPEIVATLLSSLEKVSGRNRRPLPRDDGSYTQSLLDAGPLAYWRLDEIEGTTATDASGNGNHGTFHEGVAFFLDGPPAETFSQSHPNRAVHFAGGYLEAPIARLPDQYSISLWFWNGLPSSVRAVTGVLLARGDEHNQETLLIGGNDDDRSMGKLVMRCGDRRFVGRTQLRNRSWHNVVLVRGNDTVSVFLDGQPEAEIEARLEPCLAAPTMHMGGAHEPTERFEGKLDEVAVFGRLLSVTEVVELYRQSGLRAPPGSKVDPPVKDSPGQTVQPAPTDVGQALETIHVRDGFEVQLVAAEPLVIDPVAIDWGPDGKLWVVEMADYPLGIDGKGKPGGRVRFLEDMDEDGQYDQSTLFADGLSFPTGILVWGQGVLVTAAPEILYLEDSSGDGKCDVRRVLYSGFLQGNQQLRVNGLRWGLDNWIYCASGSHHAGYGKESQIVSHVTGTKHPIGSRDFRIRPQVGLIEAQSGPSQFGRNRDDWGNWFGVQNSHPLWHYVLDDQNIRRNPHFAPPDPKHQVVTPTNPPVYPASKLQKRYHSFNQSGRFTSACSAMIYRDELLFERGSEQHAFTCEPFHNLIQHNLIQDAGTSFHFRRDPAEQTTDFFASRDRWCRPVMIRTGPDGALWIVDMYRYMIEHPQWLPQQGQDELRPFYRSGADRGRIYRVVPANRAARTIPRLDKRSTPQLVAALESPNGWQRDTAQRLLVRNAHDSAVAPLESMVTSSKQPLARLHALWTLEGLDALSARTLQAALTDAHPGVRRNAVRIASRVVVDPRKLVPLVEDSDAKVRLELASTLGQYDAAQASTALADLAVKSAGDRYLSAAVMSSLNPRNVSAVLTAAIGRVDSGSEAVALDLIGQAVAMGETDSISHTIELVCSWRNERSARARFEALARVLDVLSSRRWPVDRLPTSAADCISETIQQARATAANRTTDPHVRAASIRLLGREEARRENDFKLLQGLLVPQSPKDLQRAIVAHLARRREPPIAGVLLARWQSHSPELRHQILDALASRKPWAETLRAHLESGTVRASELSAPIRQRLLDQAKNAPQWQRALATKVTTDRDEVLRRFEPALKLNGDASRGAIVYRKLCINCHKVNHEGHEVGPQLASITNKTKEALLTSILDPSAAVDAKYFSYSIVTEDGRILTGKMETETGSSITLLAAEGKRETVLRRDIDELRASTKSLMPDGLEQGLNPQDLADLIQFVRETFR